MVAARPRITSVVVVGVATAAIGLVILQPQPPPTLGDDDRGGPKPPPAGACAPLIGMLCTLWGEREGRFDCSRKLEMERRREMEMGLGRG